MIFLAFLEAKRFGTTSKRLLIAEHGTNALSRAKRGDLHVINYGRLMGLSRKVNAWNRVLRC